MSLLYQNMALDELGTPIFLGSFNQLQGVLPMTMAFIITNQYTNGLGHHRQHTVITDPNGHVQIQSEESDFFLPNAMSGHRLDERMRTTFKEPGRFKVTVFLDSTPAIEYFFLVRERVPAPGDGAQQETLGT